MTLSGWIKVVLLLAWGLPLSAQQVVQQLTPVSGEIQLSEGIVIPKVARGYTLWLPQDTSQIEGLVVFTHHRTDTNSTDGMIDYALQNQLALLYASTENPLEFFFEENRMEEIAGYISEVTQTYHIPALLYCGMSLEGTRALKLTHYAQKRPSLHHILPRAIAICDAPLDMVRFHTEMVRAKEAAFHPATTNEGIWVSAWLEKHLGGTPEEHLEAYVAYSPYCYRAGGGSHLSSFAHIAIRAYTEPDVLWWMETRAKDYYSMNAVDLAALINALKLSGNEETELIITRNKGYFPDGTRHPHSWSIVNEKELIDWFLDLPANKK